jgi:hypothetical protein
MRSMPKTITLLDMEFSPEQLQSWLCKPGEYSPTPPIDQRDMWDSVDDALKHALIQKGERGLDFNWPALPLSTHFAFHIDGQRGPTQAAVGERRRVLGDLVLAECVENQGRFMEQILNGVWATCEETSWSPPNEQGVAGNPNLVPDIHNHGIALVSGDRGHEVALIHHLLKPRFDSFTGKVSERVTDELTARILDPYRDHDFYWWLAYHRPWMNNWSPWCVYNCLSTVLLTSDDPDRIFHAMVKTIDVIHRYVDLQPDDGGCDEGVGYWARAATMVALCLDVFRRATHGKIDLFEHPKVRAMAHFPASAHIAGNYYINFADTHHKAAPRVVNLYFCGKMCGDNALLAMASQADDPTRIVEEMKGYALYECLQYVALYAEIKALKSRGYEDLRDVWMTDLQVMTARQQAGSAAGLYLAAKAGRNNESHNHNDLGTFMVYADGEPAIIDVGVEAYRKQTFSDERYDIWTMQSAYHNVPLVDAGMQKFGDDYRADDVQYSATDERVAFSMELAGAYAADGPIKQWQRAFVYERGAQNRIVVTDTFSLKAATDDIALTLMTANKPEADNEAGTVRIPTDNSALCVTFDSDTWTASVETIDIDDDELKDDWGDQVYRLQFRPRFAMKSGTCAVVIALEDGV